MSRHASAPSIDLEGAGSAPINDVSTTLLRSILPSRPFTSLNTMTDPPSTPPSSTKSSNSSNSSTPGTPTSSNYYSSLPPSPPRIPSNLHQENESGTRSWRRDSSPMQYARTAQLHTPPNRSYPNSARTFDGNFPSGIGRNGSRERPRDDLLGEESLHTGDGARILSGGLWGGGYQMESANVTPPQVFLSPPLVPQGSFEDSRKGYSPRSKKRPSDILISAGATSQSGSSSRTVEMSLPTPTPSPRARRFYPTESSTSPLNSPSEPDFAIAIHSSPSVTADGYLSPDFPTTPSPKSSPSIRPSSPSLASFVGMVKRNPPLRRSSDLPAYSRSPTGSPTTVPPSPGFVSALSSPIVGAMRRGSYAYQAREKAKEKEVELRERADQLAKKRAKSHLRMFSWAERPDVVAAAKTSDDKSRIGWKFKLFSSLVLLGVVFSFMVIRRNSRIAIERAVPSIAVQVKRSVRVRGGENVGTSFIHPRVLGRAPPSFSGSIPSAWRRLRSFAVQISQPILDPLFLFGSSRKDPDMSWKVGAPRSRKIFASAPKVPYTINHPLPPPPIHSDVPERDTMILYRILGNDLPPRHSPGQTLRNLRFLLQHESDFSILPHLGPHTVHHSTAYGSGSGVKKSHSAEGGLLVDKYFVLNRIADKEMEAALIGLLHLYSVPNSRIIVIPFDWKEYQRRDFRWDGGVDKVAGWGISVNQTEIDAQRATIDPDSQVGEQEMKRKGESMRLRALDYMYHEKNLYAMNNNGGRNYALKHGRSLPRARWILPLDGNSFITPAAMDSIVRTISISGEGKSASRYLLIPMARLLANEDVIASNSISLVPKLPQTIPGSPAAEAELHHRSAVTPPTPDEPQIGFRYDSTETFQEAMRYGRRSKLEFLWRLGAVPYSRALDRKTLPWESSDRQHITADTWASIPGAKGTNTTSTVHQPHGEIGEGEPSRGPLAFVKAGWVNRLFSGDKQQEETTSEAVSLRSANRIKGIVALLERLDERVARGTEGCEEPTGSCGFSTDRLWSFDLDLVDSLRQAYRVGKGNKLGKQRDAVEKIERFEEAITVVDDSVRSLLANPASVSASNIQISAKNATLLAMAGYITRNTSYSQIAAKLITSRFVRQTPLFYRQNEQRDQVKKQLVVKIGEDDGFGYAFPTPPNDSLAYSAALGTRDDLPQLPFNPIEFDPILLLDAVRLLTASTGPQSDMSATLSRKTLATIFTAQLSYLLFSREAVGLCRDPPSPIAGAKYDAKLAALAAFLDDARLFGRVLNRARLRLPQESREDGIVGDGIEVKEIHEALARGAKNTRMRPFSMELPDRTGWTKDQSFGLLGL